VFKENSIYVIDVEAKSDPSLGRPYLQKIHTRGVGCSFKGAACEIPDGVLFAHTSGIYKLTRDLSIVRIGELIDRKWREALKTNPVIGVALWPDKQKALVSHSKGEDGPPRWYWSTNQFVYDFTRDKEGKVGSWTRYEGPPMLQAAKLDTGLVLLGADNKLYEMKDGTDDSHFTDIGQPISFSWIYKACDFGDSGRRKVGGGVVTSFRATNDLSGIQVHQASDMSRDFEAIPDTLTIDADKYKVVSLRSTPAQSIGRSSSPAWTLS
jgi:hypothetical protein